MQGSRIKRLLSKPAIAWQEINAEEITLPGLFFGFVLPWLLLGSVALFVGYGLVGLDTFILKIKDLKWGLWFSLRYLVSGVTVFFIAVYVIDLLAPAFNSERNLIKSAKLVAYSSTPFWISAVFLVYPMLGFLGVLGLYGVYLFYIGLPLLKKVPDDKRVIYMLVSALIIIILYWLMQVVTGSLLNLFIGDPYASTAEDMRHMYRPDGVH